MGLHSKDFQPSTYPIIKQENSNVNQYRVSQDPMSNTRNTNWYTPRTRRRVVITSASILAGLTATSIPTLAQTSVTSAKENYTDKERDNLEAMKSYFDGLKSKDTSRIRSHGSSRR